MKRKSYGFLSVAIVIIVFLFMTGVGICDVQRTLVTVTIDLSSHGSKEEAKLWLPYPVSDKYQLITNVKIEGTYSSHGFYTDQEFGNHILYAYWPKGKKERRLILSFEVTRRERKDKALSGSGCVDKVSLAKYLKGSKVAPINEAVKALSEEITRGKHGTLEKARSIYLWVAKNMRRDPKTKGCGRGNVCLLLSKKSGKCADIHSVFVALLKGAGVPAREVFGLRLAKTDGVNITKWQHCWAEFYVPGYGWFVADPGDFLKALLKKKLCYDSPEAKGLLLYYFGAVDPYRVRFGTGRDINLNPRNKKGPLNYFMYPYAEIGGKPLDPLAPEEFSYEIIQKNLE